MSDEFKPENSNSDIFPEPEKGEGLFSGDDTSKLDSELQESSLQYSPLDCQLDSQRPYSERLDSDPSISQNYDKLYRSQVLLNALGNEELKEVSGLVISSVMAQVKNERKGFLTSTESRGSSLSPGSSLGGAYENQRHPGDASLRSSASDRKGFSAIRPVILKSRWFQYIATSAVVALIAIGGFMVFNSLEETQYSEGFSRYREYATKNGQRATFNLPDGSQVVLNVGSQIRVPEDFNTAQRLVYLEGEAQFAVSHDAAKPFVVNAQGNLIKDLATVFSIKAYPGEGRTTVYVAAGAVSVKSKLASSESAVLQAGDLALVTAGHEMHVERDVNPGRYMGWVYGTLVFENAPLNLVLLDLSKWFDVSFMVMDASINERRITTRISNESTSEAVIADLADILDVEVIKNGKTVTFRSRTINVPPKQ